MDWPGPEGRETDLAFPSRSIDPGPRGETEGTRRIEIFRRSLRSSDRSSPGEEEGKDPFALVPCRFWGGTRKRSSRIRGRTGRARLGGLRKELERPSNKEGISVRMDKGTDRIPSHPQSTRSIETSLGTESILSVIDRRHERTSMHGGPGRNISRTPVGIRMLEYRFRDRSHVRRIEIGASESLLSEFHPSRARQSSP